MRVLFLLHEQYGDYESEPGNLEVRLPALASGVVTDEAVYVYQRVRKEAGFNAMVDGAMEMARSFKPDIAIYVSTWPQHCLPAYCISDIQSLGAPVLSVIWDTLLDPRLMQKIVDPYFCASQYFCDAGSFFGYARYRHWADTVYPDKGVTLLSGNNFAVGNFDRPRTASEDIDVALVGSVYGHRAELLNFLNQPGQTERAEVQQLGGLFDERKLHPMAGGSGNWLPVDEYVAAIERCKILLCPNGQPTQWGVRGKIFEFMANGAFSLIEDNPDVRAVVPAEIAVTFSDQEDCARKIDYYLVNEEARCAKAAAAQSWFRENYDQPAYWRALLEAMVERKTDLPTTSYVEQNFSAYCDAVDVRFGGAELTDQAFEVIGPADFRHIVADLGHGVDSASVGAAA